MRRKQNKEAASSASQAPTSCIPSDLSQIPLKNVNTFSDITDASGGQAMFTGSLQAKSLGLSEFTFSSSFFKCLQAKLEAALWEHYLVSKTQENENVLVNMSAKKTETFVKFPICPDLQLPFVGKVTMMKTKHSLPFVTLFGVPFWIDDCQSVDILIPAWSCKTVTRADIAYFKMQTKKCKVVIINEGHEGGSEQEPLPKLSVFLVQVESAGTGSDDDNDASVDVVPKWGLSHRHCTTDAFLTNLVPLPDVQAKVEKEITLQKTRAEKQARSEVEKFLKQRKEQTQGQSQAKTKKGKAAKGGASSSVDHLADALYVDGLPDDPRDKIRALESMVETQEKLDSVIQKAKDKIVVPSKVAITKMASEEARTSASGRAKAMQEALAAAKLADEGKGQTETEDTSAAVALGLGALRGFVDKSAGKISVNKSSSKEKKSESTDLAKMGKHLLK